MDPYYSSRYKYLPSREVVWREITKYLFPYIPENSRVLDLGAGYCGFINNIKAGQKYALDVSSDFAKHASPEVKKIISKAWNAEGIEDLSVDVVHASNLLEHLTDEEIEKTFSEIKRVLKKGGLLILIQPNFKYCFRQYFDDPTHKKIFTDAGLESLLKSQNYSIILKKPKFLPFSMKNTSNLFALGLMVRLYLRFFCKPFAGQMLFIAKKND